MSYQYGRRERWIKRKDIFSSLLFPSILCFLSTSTKRSIDARVSFDRQQSPIWLFRSIRRKFLASLSFAILQHKKFQTCTLQFRVIFQNAWYYRLHSTIILYGKSTLLRLGLVPSRTLSISLVLALSLTWTERFHGPSSFLLSADAQRRNDLSGLCVSMTIMQSSTPGYAARMIATSCCTV